MKLPSIDQIFAWDTIISNYLNNLSGNTILYGSIIAAIGFKPLLHVFQEHGIIEVKQNSNKTGSKR